MGDDPHSEPNSHPHHGGHISGGPNYQNNILIPISERILPDGAEAWQLVALAYNQESGEEVLCSEDDLHKNWVKKHCNNFKKTQVPQDHIRRIGFIVALGLKGVFRGNPILEFLEGCRPMRIMFCHHPRERMMIMMTTMMLLMRVMEWMCVRLIESCLSSLCHSSLCSTGPSTPPTQML